MLGHYSGIYVVCTMMYGCLMAAFNAICVAYIMKRYPAHCSGNLSSFIGIGQTFFSLMGSFLSSALAVHDWPIYIITFVSLFIGFICLRVLKEIPGSWTLKYCFSGFRRC